MGDRGIFLFTASREEFLSAIERYVEFYNKRRYTLLATITG